MRIGGSFLFVPLLLAGCVVPDREAEPVQQEEQAEESLGSGEVVSQGMPALPEDRAMSGEERADCTQSGGIVERRGMAQTEVCVKAYADAGKACTDGDQCEGRCIAEGQVGSEPEETVTGICQRDDHLFGCFGIVENGRIESGLCVD